MGAKRNPAVQAVLAVVALALLAAGGYLIYQKRGPAYARQSRIAEARRAAESALSAPASPGAFEEVQVSIARADTEPELRIGGIIPAAADARALADALINADPPLPIVWGVRIDEYRATAHEVRLERPFDRALIAQEIERQRAARGSATPRRGASRP